MFLGNIIYGLAYRSNFLYLILIGRIVAGFGFIAFMYSKRYCSDHRIVGIRRRTTLAGAIHTHYYPPNKSLIAFIFLQVGLSWDKDLDSALAHLSEVYSTKSVSETTYSTATPLLDG